MSSKRTILITGCSDGSLGSALAVAFHRRNWRVIASARNESKMKTVKEAGIECVTMDISSEDSVATAVERVKELAGGILDGLINNAGGGYSVPVIDMDFAAGQRLFELNVFSVVRVTRAFVPLLRKSQSNPIIVNNTSGSGLLGCGTAFQGVYAASKAAASSITESLRLELAPFGIRVINLVTGGVESNFHNNCNQSTRATLPEGSLYTPAKEAIEATMNGELPGMKRTDPETWAALVAGDLSQKKPPYMIFRGAMSTVARLVTHLPLGTADGTAKKMAALDVFEEKLRTAKGQGK